MRKNLICSSMPPRLTESPSCNTYNRPLLKIVLPLPCAHPSTSTQNLPPLHILLCCCSHLHSQSEQLFGSLRDSAPKRGPLSTATVRRCYCPMNRYSWGSQGDFKKKPKLKSTWHALVPVTTWNADRWAIPQRLCCMARLKCEAVLMTFIKFWGEKSPFHSLPPPRI